MSHCLRVLRKTSHAVNPIPPGIAKKTVPASMLGQLPSYPGYEWRVVGDDLVLIALSTAVVTTIINGVFR